MVRRHAPTRNQYQCQSGWRPEASGRPTNPGNISVTASYPRLALVYVAPRWIGVR